MATMATMATQIRKIFTTIAMLFVLNLMCMTVPADSQAQFESSSIVRIAGQSWDELSPAERERALKNFQRFQQLPEKRKRDLQNSYDRWQNLPSPERKRILKNYNRYRKMDSDQKDEFRLKYKHWRSRKR